jgi:hypothetical protein
MVATVKQITIVGDIAYVPLTQGYEAIIDVADVPLVAPFNWCATVCSRTIYAVREDRTGEKPKKVYMHRVIMAAPTDLQVDHKSGNGIDNRRVNLRLATQSQNLKNCRKPSNNKSGHKGVSFFKRDGNWRAYISVDGVRRHLGYFHSIDDAAAAYREASKCMHGEFGKAA